MRARQHVMAALTALLLAGAGVCTSVVARDGYDQQQWWNPGDWFDSNPQYNLFSDRYRNNHQGKSDTWDSNPSYDYGYYDNWDYDSDYSDNNNWDHDSDYGYNDSWNDNHDGVGTTGSYEYGIDSDSDE